MYESRCNKEEHAHVTYLLAQVITALEEGRGADDCQLDDDYVVRDVHPAEGSHADSDADSDLECDEGK